jgi:hypothetical protein
MKSVFTLSLCALLTLCAISEAQEIGKVQEPEYDFVYQYLDQANGSLLALERQTPSANFRTKFMGYGGAKSTYEVRGGKSPVRFKADQKIELVVRGIPATLDPSTIIKLVRFDAKKDKRELVVGKVGALGLGGSSVSPDAGSLPINTTRYGSYSLRISPAESLQPGEYGVISSSQFFCFGIDPADKR